MHINLDTLIREERNPYKPEDHLEKLSAYQLLQSGDIEAAMANLSKCLLVSPLSFGTLRVLKDMAIAHGNLTAANVVSEINYEQNSEIFFTFTDHLETLINCGKSKQAIELIKRDYLKYDSPQSLVNLSQILIDSGVRQFASTLLLRALGKQECDDKTFFQCVEKLILVKELKRVQIKFEEIGDISCWSIDRIICTAGIFLLNIKPDLAENILLEVSERNLSEKQKDLYYFQLAKIYSLYGRPEICIGFTDQISHFIEKDTDFFVEVTLLKAQCHRLLGNRESAVNYLSKLLKNPAVPNNVISQVEAQERHQSDWDVKYLGESTDFKNNNSSNHKSELDRTTVGPASGLNVKTLNIPSLVISPCDPETQVYEVLKLYENDELTDGEYVAYLFKLGHLFLLLGKGELAKQVFRFSNDIARRFIKDSDVEKYKENFDLSFYVNTILLHDNTYTQPLSNVSLRPSGPTIFVGVPEDPIEKLFSKVTANFAHKVHDVTSFNLDLIDEFSLSFRNLVRNGASLSAFESCVVQYRNNFFNFHGPIFEANLIPVVFLGYNLHSVAACSLLFPKLVVIHEELDHGKNAELMFCNLYSWGKEFSYTQNELRNFLRSYDEALEEIKGLKSISAISLTDMRTKTENFSSLRNLLASNSIFSNDLLHFDDIKEIIMQCS